MIILEPTSYTIRFYDEAPSDSDIYPPYRAICLIQSFHKTAFISALYGKIRSSDIPTVCEELKSLGFTQVISFRPAGHTAPNSTLIKDGPFAGLWATQL